MWAYIIRRLLYYFPLYLFILLAVMLLLRVNQNNAVNQQLGKQPTQEQIDQIRRDLGLDRNLIFPSFGDVPEVEEGDKDAASYLRRLMGTSQYLDYVADVFTLGFEERSWDRKEKVGDMIRSAIPPTLMITVPSIFLTACISIMVGLLSSYTRGRWLDRALMITAVLGMSVSYLVYIIMGQYFFAAILSERMGLLPFATNGYEPVFGFLEPGEEKGINLWNWVKYVSLPVIIGVIVSMGYDTRFYRAVMVEESTKDHITTAIAKGAKGSKIMGVHMLKNAMIPIITRITITLPFAITGSILVERYFRIPGMGNMLLDGITSYDFPVVQAVVALLAAAVIVTVILTDVMYALVDPRVRLQ